MIETNFKLLEAWVSGLNYTVLGWQLLLLALAVFMGAMVYRTLGVRLLKISGEFEEQGLRHIGLHSVERIVFPLSILLFIQIGRMVLNRLEFGTDLLGVAGPLLLSLAIIRLAVYVLRKTLRPGPAAVAWESMVSTSVWVLVALHLVGWLPELIKGLDAFGYSFGETRISLLTALQLILVIAALMLLAGWIAQLIEQGLSRSAYISASVRVGVVKVSKLALYAIAGMLALGAVGINLGALAVFGGALGVGLGFGLQRIASNFISGFILVFDRSIRPGDVISINDKFGWVQELRARYIVVRDRDGVETLIPNENLITTEVINWSYSDPQIRIKLPVQISYEDDPEEAMNVLIKAAEVSSRVLMKPSPAARLIGFGDSGIDLELRVWIRDPQAGVGNVRSDLNVAIWKGFNEAGISIPYPQQDLHIKELPGSG